MAALGKRSTAPEEECNLDPWGQPWIRKAELQEAEARVRRARITPVWALCMLDAGLVAPGYEENAEDLVWANQTVQHAKRQREFLAQKKKEEEQEKEVQERSTAKKQKTEEDSDAECDCGICECEKKGMAVAVMCDKKMSRYDDCKACAFEQKSPNLHRLRHTCGGVSNIHLDWRPEHDEEDEYDEEDEEDEEEDEEDEKE